MAAVEYYDDHGRPGPHPTFLQFPADPLLRGKRVLIVDEVWDSGTTIHAVTERVRQAGGDPATAVLHYKPARSVVAGAAGRPRRRDRCLGRLSIQGRRLTERPGASGVTRWNVDRILAMTRVLLLVGTPKGAFILESDAAAAGLGRPRAAVRGLADPRPDRRARQRATSSPPAGPVVRPGGLAERRTSARRGPIRRPA